MQWLLLLSFCLCIIMIYSFKISPKWYNFVFSRQNYTKNRWRCIGRIWLGILKKYFAWKLCIMKVCYGPNISSVWKSSMWMILHGFLADWLYILTDKKRIQHTLPYYFIKCRNIILFGNYKSYACSILVGFPTLNKVQWSKTSVGRFEGIAWLAHCLTFRVMGV